ncbi:hypothetical protein ABZP36_018325 [Zizania latifolia]
MAFCTRACCCLLLVSLALLQLGMAMDPVGSICSGGIYPKGSKALANINSTVHELAAKASTSGFATSSIGKGSTAIYGLAQCRGDVSACRCKACLAAAAGQILKICNDAYELKIWFDYCFMRYKNANFIGQMDAGDSVNLASALTMDNPRTFQKAVGKVMGKATAQAVAAGSGGLGRAKQQYTPFVSIYGLAECSRDLPTLACAQCLSTAVSTFNDSCGAAQGCQINYASCRVHYEIKPFYFPLADGSGATTDMTKYDTKTTVGHP